MLQRNSKWHCSSKNGQTNTITTYIDSSATRWHQQAKARRRVSAASELCSDPRWIKVTFRKASGEEKTVEGNEGDDIVDLSWEYDLDIEAACEKSIACSTCHIILEPDVYDRLEEPTD